MKTLEPEQWRVLGRLIYLCGERAHLDIMLKSQEVTSESVCDLVERGLVVAKLNGERIDLTPGLIRTHRKRVILRLSKAGESYNWNDPHRVLRSIGRARDGMSLTYLLGMILFDDITELAREGLIYGLTADGPVDLANARQRWSPSDHLLLPGGAELRTRDVTVKTTRAGQLYCDL